MSTHDVSNILHSTHHTISIANTYTAHRRHRHHQVRVASLVVVNQARAITHRRLGRPVVRAESRAVVQVHRHGHLAVGNRASQVVVHRLHGVLAERVASLVVTLHQARVAHGIHLVVINSHHILNLLMEVEEGIRRPSLHIPSHRIPNHRIQNHHLLLLPRIHIPNHHTLNHPTLNQATLNHRTLNHPILNQVTHLISPRTMDTMEATVANGGQVALLAAHGHRVVGSQARVEEALREVHRVAGDHQARGRVASLVEGI